MPNLTPTSTDRLNQIESRERLVVSSPYLTELESFFAAQEPTVCRMITAASRQDIADLDVIEMTPEETPDLELFRPIVESMARTGVFPSGCVYMGHTRWNDIVSTEDYRVANIVKILCNRIFTRLVERIPEGPCNIVILGVGNGYDGYAILKAFAEAGKKHSVNLFLVDQNLAGLQNAAKVLEDPESPFYVSRESLDYNINLIHADFTEDGFNSIELPQEIRDLPTSVMMKGITSGNFNDPELFAAFKNNLSKDNFLYVDSAINEHYDEMTSEQIAELLKNYDNLDYKGLVLTNWIKFLRFLGFKQNYSQHLANLSVDWSVETDGFVVRYVYSLSQEMIERIREVYSVTLSSKETLYISKRRGTDEFQKKLRSNDLNMREVSSEPGVTAYLAQYQPTL